jgi:hypothetical protein
MNLRQHWLDNDNRLRISVQSLLPLFKDLLPLLRFFHKVHVFHHIYAKYIISSVA